MACGSVGHRGEVWLEKGLLCSKQRCPSSLVVLSHQAKERAAMDVVVIGVDPHKRSVTVTVEARDVREVLRATGSFPTTTAGYRAMLTIARQWPKRLGSDAPMDVKRRWVAGWLVRVVVGGRGVRGLRSV
jgi:hypothetical protein